MTVPTPRIRVARVYDDLDDPPVSRVLVDRLWPRGIRKDDPRTGDWEPAVAPSDELRRWYGHDPDRFAEFARRYRRELDRAPRSAALSRLRARAEDGPLVLVTATRDVEHSQAQVLAERLRRSLARRRSRA